MQKETNVSHGMRWGTIIGVVYCLLLFLRYDLGEKNPILLTVITFIGFVIVMALLLLCGINRRKRLGGYIEIKDAFQTMFVAVICFEIFYSAFNFIYLKYINPHFFQNLKTAMEKLMQQNHIEQSKIDEAVNKIDVDTSRNLNLGTSFISFAYGICLSGIFALLFAVIIKRKRIPQRTDQENYLQAQQ